MVLVAEKLPSLSSSPFPVRLFLQLLIGVQNARPRSLAAAVPLDPELLRATATVAGGVTTAAAGGAATATAGGVQATGPGGG